MYYDSNNQSLRFASKELNGDYLWSFWKEGDKIAIKSYNGQYIGDGTNSAFGVVNEANYSYYIQEAYDMLGLHMILMIVTAALVALLPVYRKLLKKINTSIAVEYSEDMAEIEINE